MKYHPQPCLLALLLMGSSAAWAADSVTLYGVVDSGLKYEQIRYQDGHFDTRASRFGVEDGYYKSSRWGLKGTEDLGGGLRALFLLETKFKTYDGTGKGGFTSKAFVGLSADSWGTLTFGRQKSASKDFHSPNTVKDIGKAKRAFGGHGITGNSLIKYVTPSVNGLQAGVSYSIQGTRTRGAGGLHNTDTENYLSAAVRYKAGPWNVAASFDRSRGLDDHKQAQDYAVKNWMLSGTYDFKVLKLALAYGQDRNGKLNRPAGIKDVAGTQPTLGGHNIIGAYNRDGFKSHNTYVGVAAPLGPGKLGLAWLRSSSNLDDVFYDHTGHGLRSQTQNIYAAQYTYPLSKRTLLYVHGSYATGMAYVRDLKGKAAGVGINHQF